MVNRIRRWLLERRAVEKQRLVFICDRKDSLKKKNKLLFFR